VTRASAAQSWRAPSVLWLVASPEKSWRKWPPATVNVTVSNAYDASAPSSPRMHRTGSRRIRWPHAERTSAAARSWRRRLHHVLRCTSEAAAAHLRRLEASSMRLWDPASAKVGQARARRSAASHARTGRADPLPSTSAQALTASVAALEPPRSDHRHGLPQRRHAPIPWCNAGMLCTLCCAVCPARSVRWPRRPERTCGRHPWQPFRASQPSASYAELLFHAGYRDAGRLGGLVQG
jgi:hypothetical protein